LAREARGDGVRSERWLRSLEEKEFFDILDTNLKQGKQRIVWKDPC